MVVGRKGVMIDMQRDGFFGGKRKRGGGGREME